MTIEELKNKIWNFQNDLNEIEKKYWINIMISLSTIDNGSRKFITESNPEIAIGYAKLVIMELWTIRELLLSLQLSIETYDTTFWNIKKFRDSYAHIKERIQGKEKPFKQPERKLLWEKRTIANGKGISSDGINWEMENVKRLFNVQFDGNEGVMSIFGIIDNFLICNSGDELLELEINETLVANLTKLINEACG